MNNSNIQMEKKVPRGKNVATILAIGTANPPNFILQSDYPDFYFKDVDINSDDDDDDHDHLQRLKLKFKSICENTKIEKRYVVLTEEFLKQNTENGNYESLSLEKRLKLPTEEVVKLAKEASLKAIKEWGQPISQITHLIFYTTSCFGSVPGPDSRLAKLLNLKPTVNRLMMFVHGCHAGGTILRVAKDIAENNVGSRVLAVYGAAAMIIGSDPNFSIEKPVFEIVSASQTTVPDTENMIRGQPGQMGRLVYHLDKNLPNVVANNVEKCLIGFFNEDFDWNKLFYAIHPGGPLVLSKVEEKLGLSEEKLRESWGVLKEYGNMWSPTVIFILDEMRKKSKNEGKGTTGEGLEWGVLLGFGPGVAIETVLLHSVSCVDQ
ncbi:hypothetical protein TSUD_402260 [Trifolium subterraneum]|uniref:chalcone synthase n=1 Tax=Trifolium subterraneum TaxID=3900 RepID=A0A2Z6PJT1_TRISU|nr:hypothetical protein TSUD_402260 [Trifolium subterraneum]